MPLPEQRVLNVCGVQPVPVRRLPPLRIAVATGVHEFAKGVVRHVVALDLESLDAGARCRTLVVPAELERLAIEAEGCAAGRKLDPFLAGNSPVFRHAAVGGTPLLLEWQ